MKIKNVGFIGLGAMGSVMAPLIVQAVTMFLVTIYILKLTNPLVSNKSPTLENLII